MRSHDSPPTDEQINSHQKEYTEYLQSKQDDKYEWVEKAVSSVKYEDLTQTKRVRSVGCFKEVRISHEPAFGLRVEVDVAISDLEVGRLSPVELEKSNLERDPVELLDADEGVTGFEEAIPDEDFEHLIRVLADGADNSLDSVRVSIDHFGQCMQAYAGDGDGVAIFATYF
jgi:hypothetical protein